VGDEESLAETINDGDENLKVVEALQLFPYRDFLCLVFLFYGGKV